MRALELLTALPFSWTGAHEDGTPVIIRLVACDPEECDGTHVAVELDGDDGVQSFPTASVEEALHWLADAASSWLASGSMTARANALAMLPFLGRWIEGYNGLANTSGMVH